MRTYKLKNPYCLGTKLSIGAFEKVLEGFACGWEIARSSDEAGCSRTSVHRLYAALGERVHWLLAGHLPDFESVEATRALAGTKVRGTLAAKAREEPVWYRLQRAGSYIGFRTYRDRDLKGVIDGRDAALSPLQRDPVYDTVHQISRKGRGFPPATFHRHFSRAVLWQIAADILKESHPEPRTVTGGDLVTLIFQIMRLSLLEQPLRPQLSIKNPISKISLEDSRRPRVSRFKNPYVKNSKISVPQFHNIAFYFAAGVSTAEEVRQETGLSRQTIQRTTQALGEYVHVLLEERRFPSFDTPQARRYMQPEIWGAFKPMRAVMKELLEVFAPKITYQEFLAYREDGHIAGDSNPFLQSFIYRQYEHARKTIRFRRGASMESYRRLVALARFRLAIAGYMDLARKQNYQFPDGKTFMWFVFYQVLMGALVERPLEPARLLGSHRGRRGGGGEES